MSEMAELEKKLKLTMNQLKECFEMSLRIRTGEPENKNRVLKYWEDFGKHFLDYVKRREKETGQEIMSLFSLGSLFRFFR